MSYCAQRRNCAKTAAIAAHACGLGAEAFADPNGLAGEWPIAVAYVGPGAGLAALGVLLTIVGMVVLMAVGFLWYPLTRLRTARRRRAIGEMDGVESGGKASFDPQNLEQRFAAPDRFLHYMAFSTIPVQKALADLEDRLYAERIADIRIERPVFIASLPRAGTTVLLESLCSSGAFAAHTYRNMPFLFIPILWNALSRRFHLPATSIERLHGDGLRVGHDSAEAFEEALWRAFHPSRYLPDRVLPWPEDGLASDEFRSFLKNHIRKLIALHVANGRASGTTAASSSAPRYLSKNNGNLARLGEIGRLFPDATVLVPLRNPADHAASLLRTHMRFVEIHAKSAFARRYMADIGHFDFGANLRCIDFDHWLDRAATAPASANHWLSYWCAAFEHVLANLGDHVVLVDYDGLCKQPAAHLERIAERTALPQRNALAQAAARFRAPEGDDAPLGFDGSLLDRARAVHQRLLTRCWA